MNITTLTAALATLLLSFGALAQSTAVPSNLAAPKAPLTSVVEPIDAQPTIAQANEKPFEQPAPTTSEQPNGNAALEQSLLDRGFVKQTDGLYMDQSSKDPSYIAIDANGMKALAIQIDQDRQRYQKIAAKEGISMQETRLDQALLKSSADLATLAINLPENVVSCLSANPERSAASVTASGGTSASAAAVSAAAASASASTTPSSETSVPELTTYNVAQSYVESANNSATSIGATPATAMNTDHHSCFSYAIASLACADPNKLAAIAYAPSFSTRRECASP
jgi:hypothetical protein